MKAQQSVHDDNVKALENTRLELDKANDETRSAKQRIEKLETENRKLRDDQAMLLRGERSPPAAKNASPDRKAGRDYAEKEAEEEPKATGHDDKGPSHEELLLSPGVLHFKQIKISGSALRPGTKPMIRVTLEGLPGTRPYPVAKTEALPRGEESVAWDAALALKYPGVSSAREGQDLSLAFELLDMSTDRGVVLARKDAKAVSYLQKSRDGTQVIKLAKDRKVGTGPGGSVELEVEYTPTQ